MEKYQNFNGKRFCRDEGSGYYWNSVLRERLHRYVWEYYNGKIPKGYHVHHKDEDKTNNDIANLELMEGKDHLSHHAKKMHKENYGRTVKNLKEKAQPKAKEWHGSKEGLEWHSKHAKKALGSLGKREYICEQCGKKYKTKPLGKNRFCSNKCKAKWRRESGVDNETRVCEYCRREFTVNKYSKTRFCSRSCNKSDYWAKK